MIKAWQPCLDSPCLECYWYRPTAGEGTWWERGIAMLWGMQGGFDGVNIFNEDKSKLKNAAAKREVDDNTAQGGTKPAKLESGITINVPLFINKDDVIRVDTKEKRYLERIK